MYTYKLDVIIDEVSPGGVDVTTLISGGWRLSGKKILIYDKFDRLPCSH
jgi:hypothetical protein